jgi:hypothetical protein
MPKSYAQFKYEDISTLGLTLKRRDFITDFKSIKPTELLVELLKINAKMVLNTEKAKSEFLIAPILYEIARKNIDKVSFFSGHNLDVDKDLGLKGFCDFLFTKVPESSYIKDPNFVCSGSKK